MTVAGGAGGNGSTTGRVARRWKLRHKPITLLVSTLLGALLLAGILAILWQRDSRDKALSPYSLTLVDQHGRPVTTRRGNLRMMLDPFTVYRNQPDQRTEFFTIDGRGNRATPPRPGATKLVLLGGSALFGFYLPSDDTTFAWLLGERFPDLEVVNSGVPGYLSGEELATMVHRFDPGEAIAYVVFDGWNEILDQLHFQRRQAYEFGFNNQFLRIESRLYQLYAQESGIKPEPEPELPPDDDGYFDRLCKAYESNIARMQAVALGRGADLLVVLQPELGAKLTLTESEQAAMAAFAAHSGYQTFPDRYAAFRARARAYCARRGICVLDLAEHPSLREGEAELFYDPVHLNEEGHRTVARILGQRLAALLED